MMSWTGTRFMIMHLTPNSLMPGVRPDYLLTQLNLPRVGLYKGHSSPASGQARVIHVSRQC